MKLTTGILILGMATGSAWAQNPDIIQNTRDTMKAVVQKKAIDSNAVLAASQPSSNPASVTTNNSAPTPSKPAVATTSSAPKAAAAKAQLASAPKPKPTAKVQVATAQKPNAGKKAAVKKPVQAKEQVAVESSKAPVEKKDEPKQISLTGRRDPFLSPVVNRSMVGSGCSTGKKCLAVDQVALKGVIQAQSGMIAVVVNAMNKAYFLRENDPVFNGYVVRITGDSIIFKETMQDKLGKNFTREVTKKIVTPAV
jgi:Tfp pilus assembly protein PilP